MGPCWTQGQLSPRPYRHPPSLLTVLQVSADINITSIYILNLQLKLNPFPPIPAKTVPYYLILFSKDRQFGLSRENLALGRKELTGPI